MSPCTIMASLKVTDQVVILFVGDAAIPRHSEKALFNTSPYSHKIGLRPRYLAKKNVTFWKKLGLKGSLGRLRVLIFTAIC